MSKSVTRFVEGALKSPATTSDEAHFALFCSCRRVIGHYNFGMSKVVCASAQFASIKHWKLKMDMKFLSSISMFTVCDGIYFFIMDDDRVMVMGNDRDSRGRLGFGARVIQVNNPTELLQLRNQGVCKIVGGVGFQLALTKDARVFGWGSNRCHVLGQDNDLQPQVFKPILIQLGEPHEKICHIAVGSLYCMAITKDNRVYEWGQHVFNIKPCKKKTFSNIVNIDCESRGNIIALDSQNRLYGESGERIPFPAMRMKTIVAGCFDDTALKIILTIEGKAYVIDNHDSPREICSRSDIPYLINVCLHPLKGVWAQCCEGIIYQAVDKKKVYKNKRLKLADKIEWRKANGYANISNIFEMQDRLPFMMVLVPPNQSDPTGDFSQIHAKVSTNYDHSAMIDLAAMATTLGSQFRRRVAKLLLKNLRPENCCKMLQMCLHFKLNVLEEVGVYVLRHKYPQLEEKAVEAFSLQILHRRFGAFEITPSIPELEFKNSP